MSDEKWIVEFRAWRRENYPGLVAFMDALPADFDASTLEFGWSDEVPVIRSTAGRA